MANKKTSPLPDFEGALKQLESIVSKMEGGKLNLEQALQHFENGVSLARQCQQALRQAEQRVEQLVQQDKPEE